MYEGSRAISKARAPAGSEGFEEGERGDQGARAKGSLPGSLRSAGLCGGEITACAAAPIATAPSDEQYCFLPALSNVCLSAT